MERQWIRHQTSGDLDERKVGNLGKGKKCKITK